MSKIKRLKYFVNGKWCQSNTKKYMDIYNPSTGEKIAEAPCCTEEEIILSIKAAKAAFSEWSNTPVMKRVQVLYKFRNLIEKYMEELIHLVSTENGKVLSESLGDIAKVKELVEIGCSTPTMMMGESLMNASAGYDTVVYREPLGVFVGIPAYNFPAMLPMGWIMPLCIATGNTLVIKATSIVPLSAMRCMELLQESGLPDGVVNIVTCSRNEAELFLKHPDIKGVSFIGSTSVGSHIYATAAAHGKRVQALTEAKNHGLVLEDASLERTARVIINSSFGVAGQRCMALPVIVAQESIADKLVSLLIKYASELQIGPGTDTASQLGPLVSSSQKQFVLEMIEKGIKEGAKLVLDGRNVIVKNYEKGFYVGPTIFDYVTPEMTIGDDEIFGPVICVKRVKNFEEAVRIMNTNRFANGSAIFTESGYYSREFVSRSHGGMIGINVGIPVPTSLFSFTGHKDSFFGDLHALGKDGVRFYTELKTVTSKWFGVEEKKNNIVTTWEGSIGEGTK